MEALGALLLKKRGVFVVLNKHLGCWELGDECDKCIGKWRPQNGDQSSRENQLTWLHQMYLEKKTETGCTLN